eukprot:4769317-Ditylum_brightwellii.AAC.1
MLVLPVGTNLQQNLWATKLVFPLDPNLQYQPTTKPSGNHWFSQWSSKVQKNHWAIKLDIPVVTLTSTRHKTIQVGS